MSDDLSSAIAQLKVSARRLNEITDEAARVIRTVEDFLNDDCHVGVPARITLSEWSPPSGVTFTTELAYVRVGRRFRIAIIEGTDVEDEESLTPWSDCPRDQKLLSLQKLPDLLVAITRSIEEKIADAEAGVRTVTRVLGALQGKGR